jgi:TRAP-type C4-dicarboxylate transport system permease small subunit
VSEDLAVRHPWLAQAELWGRRIEDLLLTILLLGLVVLASAQILLRNVLSIGVPWADGLVRLAVLWIALLGAVAASRDHKHIAVGLVSRLRSQRLRTVAGVLSSLFTAVVTALLAWYSSRFVADSRTYGDVLLNNLPAWVFQIILPIGFALISYRYVVRAVQQILVRR